MAVPVIPAGTSGVQSVSGANGTTFVPTKPVGLAAGDLLVAMFYTDATGTVTMPSGFTDQFNLSPTSPMHARLDWKIADSTDAAATNFTWSWTGSVWRVGALIRLTGAATSGTPFENAGSGTNTNSVANNNASLPNAVLTGAATVDDLGLMSTMISNDNAPTWSAQSTWTLVFNSGDDIGIVKISLTSGTAAPATSHVVISDNNANSGPGVTEVIAVMSPAAGGQDTPELDGRPFGSRGSRMMLQLLAG